MSDGARLYPDEEAHIFVADVNDTPLDEVLLSDDSVLDRSLRRVLSENDLQGEKNYAAHSNSTA